MPFFFLQNVSIDWGQTTKLPSHLESCIRFFHFYMIDFLSHEGESCFISFYKISVHFLYLKLHTFFLYFKLAYIDFLGHEEVPCFIFFFYMIVHSPLEGSTVHVNLLLLFFCKGVNLLCHKSTTATQSLSMTCSTFQCLQLNIPAAAQWQSDADKDREMREIVSCSSPCPSISILD